LCLNLQSFIFPDSDLSCPTAHAALVNFARVASAEELTRNGVSLVSTPLQFSNVIESGPGNLRVSRNFTTMLQSRTEKYFGLTLHLGDCIVLPGFFVRGRRKWDRWQEASCSAILSSRAQQKLTFHLKFRLRHFSMLYRLFLPLDADVSSM